MREIIFYRTENDRCPVEEFLDKLSDKQVEKVLWVLRIIRELERVPIQYFKNLINTNHIWEVRVQLGNNIFRLLGFIEGSKVILTNGFAKKTQRVPREEIKIAEKRKKGYFERKDNG